MKAADDKEGKALGRIARGAVHTLGSMYIGRLVNWIAIIVLTRQLSPEDFGHVALAASLLALCIALRNFGLHFALLHHYDRVDELAPTHFVLNTGLGALGALVAIALAVLLVDSHYGRTVATALAVFAAFDLLRATALTAETQLRHDLEFSSVAGAHAAALILSAAAGIAVAYLGGGIWALILSHSIYGIAYVACYCVLIWRHRSPLRLRLSEFDPAGARSLLGYGARIWAGLILQALLLNFDRLIVYALLNPAILGFYDRAHVFAQLPTGAVANLISGVTGTVFARYQQGRQQLSGAFRRTLRLVLRSTLPFSVLIAVEAPILTRLLLGEAWLPMAPILRYLLIYSLCRPLIETVQALLRSVGDARGIVGFASIQTGVLLVAAPLLTWTLGIEGTALSMNLTALIGVILALRRTTHCVEVPWVRTFVPPLLATGAAAAVRLSATGFVDRFPAPVALLTGAALFSLSYGIALLLLERRTLLNELRTLWTVLGKGGE